MTPKDVCQRCGAQPGLNRAGKPRVHGHHCDYAKPRDLLYLCGSCHRHWHGKYSPVGSDHANRVTWHPRFLGEFLESRGALKGKRKDDLFKGENLVIRITIPQKKALEKEAEKRGVRVSDLVRGPILALIGGGQK